LAIQLLFTVQNEDPSFFKFLRLDQTERRIICWMIQTVVFASTSNVLCNSALIFADSFLDFCIGKYQGKITQYI
jgi:hypothetical protein